jgi:hypothetical protein
MKRTTPPMSTHNNAALMLTVLSACLVLLCGGTMSATAQRAAATSRAKAAPPRQETAPRVTQADVRPLREFFTKLKQRVARGEFDPEQNFALTVTTQRVRSGRFADFRFTAQRGDVKSLATAKEFLAALQKCQLLEAVAEDAARLVLKLEADEKDVIIHAAFTIAQETRAQALYNEYSKLFPALAAARKGKSEAVFYENTKALASAQEFVIVSRLPRAALNKLLTQ